jgi:hypothetical protein
LYKTDPTESGLGLAPTTGPPGRCTASQLIDAYWRVVHLRHELTQARGADRQIATAVAALDAVSLALAGAAIAAVDRETTELSEQGAHETDRG